MFTVCISIEFTQSKVYVEDFVLILISRAYQKVIRFNVPVYDVVLVDNFEMREQLNCNLSNC